MLGSRDKAAFAAVHAVHRHCPVAQLEGGARVAHGHLEAVAGLVAAVAEPERAADASSIDDLPAKVGLAELGPPERSFRALLMGEARDDVRLY